MTNLAKLILPAAMLLLGAFSVVFGPASPRFADDPSKALVGGLLLITWGTLLTWYQVRGYRGGAATIIGGFLVGLGAYSACDGLLWNTPSSAKEIGLEIVVFGIFTGAGIALLMQGHRIHRRVRDENRP